MLPCIPRSLQIGYTNSNNFPWLSSLSNTQVLWYMTLKPNLSTSHTCSFSTIAWKTCMLRNQNTNLNILLVCMISSDSPLATLYSTTIDSSCSVAIKNLEAEFLLDSPILNYFLNFCKVWKKLTNGWCTGELRECRHNTKYPEPEKIYPGWSY